MDLIMCKLNINQVQVIENDVKNAKITFTHLADDLIDHICCEVEQEMNNGKSFNVAYEIVKQQTGIKVLQKIQNNTRYLIDKNYRIMKKTMKISGIISLSLLGLATVFKIMHWPGAGIGLSLGFVILCLLFFPTAVYLNYRDVKKKSKLLLHISVLIGGISLMFGILFKVMHWPAANNILLMGWIVLLLIFLPLLIYSILNGASSQKEKIIYIIGIIAFMIFELSTAFKMFHWAGASILMIFGSVLLFCVFLPLFAFMKFKESRKITGQYIFIITTSMFLILFTFLLAINMPKYILSVFVEENQNSHKTIKYMESKINNVFVEFKNLPDSVTDKYKSQIESIHFHADNLAEFINKIKIDLISSVDNVDENTAKHYLENPNEIISKDNLIFANKIIIGENNNGLAKKLKDQIDMFKSVVIGYSRNKETVENILKTKDVAEYNLIFTWEEKNFRNNVAISTLNFLSKLELSVRLIESDAIEFLINSK